MELTKYIEMMAKHSKTRYHELIIECLEKYGIEGTRELTVDQAKRFCEEKGIE